MNKSNYIRKSASSLSAKERRVVELLAAGLSNRAIARVTNRTEATVKWHLKNVFLKLGVNSRVQVVLMTMNNVEPRARAPAGADEARASV